MDATGHPCAFAATDPASTGMGFRGMESGISAIERAFQLARSGRVKDVNEIRLVLQREGYDTGQLQGPALLTQLRDAIKIAWTNVHAPRS
jgi:hypothetical protein